MNKMTKLILTGLITATVFEFVIKPKLNQLKGE